MVDLDTLSQWFVDDVNGFKSFDIPSPHGILRVVVSSADGWECVRVYGQSCAPSWDEMSFVARTFFKPDEVAVMLHVPPCDFVERHPFCLRWWRPCDAVIPVPPLYS